MMVGDYRREIDSALVLRDVNNPPVKLELLSVPAVLPTGN
jgi:hypothetical protein